MMGHNRYATKGGISIETAHPFRHGNITLCHNGTLIDHKNLLDNKEFDVDSEAICYLISTSQDVTKDLEKIKGAYALTWFNAQDSTFNMARNSQRELYLAKVISKTHKGAFIYASEAAMITWLAGRNKIEIETPTLIPEGKLLTFKLNEKNEDIIESSFTPNPYKETPYYSGSYYSKYYGKYYNDYSLEDDDEDGLSVGDIIDITFNQYAMYHSSSYGECRGVYKKETKSEDKNVSYVTKYPVILSAISFKEKGAYLHKTFKVRITSINSKKECFCVLHNKDNVIEYTPKKKTCCNNCDSEIEGVYTIARDGKPYCEDCRLMFPEYIN